MGKLQTGMGIFVAIFRISSEKNSLSYFYASRFYFERLLTISSSTIFVIKTPIIYFNEFVKNFAR